MFWLSRNDLLSISETIQSIARTLLFLLTIEEIFGRKKVVITCKNRLAFLEPPVADSRGSPARVYHSSITNVTKSGMCSSPVK